MVQNVPTESKDNTKSTEEPNDDNLQEVLRDANGFMINKDGFYLKESDDEEEAVEVKLSKKQRKKLRKQAQYSDEEDDYDSDSSTEDVLAFN